MSPTITGILNALIILMFIVSFWAGIKYAPMRFR